MPDDNEEIPFIDVTPQPTAGEGYAPHNDIWSFLRRRKGVLGVFWLLFSILGLLWILSRPNRYEAESRVMITRTGTASPVTDAEMASEIELIRDPSHLNSLVLNELKSASDARILKQRSAIDENLSARQAGKSNVLVIQFQDNDGNRAAKTVNQIVDFYLADRRVIFQPAAGRPIVEEVADPLINFDVSNGGPRLAKTLDARTERGIDLESRIAELEASLRAIRESSSALRRRLNSMPERLNTRTRVRTGAESGRTVEQTEGINPLWQQIQAELLENDAALAGLKARLAETRKALKASRAEESKLSVLASERMRLERKYEATQKKNANLNTERDADRGGTLRATLINRAIPPLSPLSRWTWLWIPLAILAALVLAFLIAWFVDWFDRPVYTSGDFEDASGAPPIDNFA